MSSNSRLSTTLTSFSAFDAVHDAVFVVSREAEIVWLNRAASELLGSPRPELVGRRLESVLAAVPGATESARALLDRAAAESIVDTEACLLVPGRERIPVAVSVSPLHLPAGDPAAYVVSAQDLSLLQSLQRETENLEAEFGKIPSPVLRIAHDGTVLYANPGSWILLEHWKTKTGGRLPDEWCRRIKRAFDIGESMEQEVQIGFKVIQLFGIPTREAGHVTLYGLDVTQRKRMQEKIALSAQVVEHASEGVMITDADFRVLDVNRAFTRITGFEAGDMLGESAIPLLSGSQGEESFMRIWGDVQKSGTWQGELWDRRKSGEVYPKWLSISAVRDEQGNLIYHTILFADITQIKEAEEHLYRLAHYDSLTGVENRRSFRDRLEDTLVQARRSGEMVALMFVDLDGFKVVNDNLGHHAGDVLLRTVAERLTASVRESDSISRIGGDEFTVLLPGLHESRDTIPIAEKILDRIREPLVIDGNEITISASVGIAIFPTECADSESLLKNADTAMYRTKQSGRNNYQFFSPGMNSRTLERLTMRTRLKRAIDSHELSVQFQPQVEPVNGTLVGVEALARWMTEDLGAISPAQFIPLAEDTGLIHELGEVVLTMALEQWVEWSRLGIRPPRLAINLSVPQLQARDFPSRLRHVIERTGAAFDGLEFEITENVFVQDAPEVVSKLNGLRSMGASLAIDDFGTGYSSLAYLKRLPVDRIKIDRAFVRDLPHEGSSAEIAGAVIAMGRSMHLEVVAEGVEQLAQLEFLKGQGCQVIQGNLFSPPAPALELESVCRSGRIELAG